MASRAALKKSAPPAPAREDVRNETKRRLLDAAAAALIENDGALEMSDVAARAGASAGLAYHYFGSKSGLVSAVLAEFFDRYDAVINMRMDGRESWAKRERRRLDALIAFLFKDPLAPIAFGRLSKTPEVVAVEAARWRALVELSAKNIENGQKSGSLSRDVDAHIAGAAILGGVRDACSFVLSQEKRPSPAALSENLWRFIAGAVRLREE